MGTAINVVAVLAGGSVGALVGTRLPDMMRETAMRAIGLITILIGVSNFLETDDLLVPLVSVILGFVIGEALNLDNALRRFGGSLQRGVLKREKPLRPGVRDD